MASSIVLNAGAEDDGDYETFARPALPVPSGLPVCSENFDEFPASAEEYLRQVRRQAEKLPQIVNAKNIKKEENISNAPVHSPPAVSSDFLPSPEFSNHFAQEFAAFRLSFAAAAAAAKNKKNLKTQNSSNNQHSTEEFVSPPLSDVSLWFSRISDFPSFSPSLSRIFPLSQAFTREIIGKIANHMEILTKQTENTEKTLFKENHLQTPVDLEEEGGASDGGEGLGEDEENSPQDENAETEEISPFPSSESSAEVSSCSSRFPRLCYCVWLYGLLVKLEKPISPSTASHLFSLSKSFHYFRSLETSSNSPQLHYWNLFLTILEKIFGQKIPQ